MAPRAKSIFNWAAIAVGITVLGVAWGASSRVTTIEGVSSAHGNCIDIIEVKQDQTDTEITAMRTRLSVLEQWKATTDERFDREISRIGNQVDQIYEMMLEDRQ